MFPKSAPPVPSSAQYQVHIDLEQRIYNPGDVVSGQVLLDLERPLACDRITARLFGSARVFFTEIMKTPGPQFGKNRAYEQEQVLVDQLAELWAADGAQRSEKPHAGGQNKEKPSKTLEEILRQCNPNAIRIGPSRQQNKTEKIGEKSQLTSETQGFSVGRHQFHFAFKLPFEGLFTSFDARNSAGSVRYYILLQAYNNGFNCLRRKLLFPVVCPKRLDSPNLIGLAMERIFEKGCDKKELLKVQLRLDKHGFVPGEPLQGTIRIENNSGHSVKRMHLCIIQRTTCFASRPEFGTHQSQFETSGMGLPVAKIMAGHSMEFPIRYYVPALVPEICVPGVIESEHLLCLEVTNKRGLAVEITTPLLIGTHPTPPMPEQHSFGQQGEIAEKGIPPAVGPPPLYEENSNNSATVAGAAVLENVPPPSYAQSVAGLSAMSESAGDARNREQQDQYSGPLCYHYNFGFSTADEEATSQSQQQKDNDRQMRKNR